MSNGNDNTINRTNAFNTISFYFCLLNPKQGKKLPSTIILEFPLNK